MVKGARFWVLVLAILLIAPLAWGKAIRLKFASYFPTAAKQSKLLEEFCADVEKRTNGQVKIDFYGGGSLLGPTKVYDGVVQGIADIGFSHVEYTVGRFPITEILDLPHAWPSAYVSTHVANDFYRKFKPEEWKDAHPLWFNISPPASIILAKKPVYKLEDLKGLTIRATGRVAEVVKVLGATPKPIPMPEVYEAMARGIVEGCMTPVETLYAFRLADVAKYVCMPWGAAPNYTFYVVMSKKVWDSLPAEVQKVFDELASEYEEKAARVWNEVDLIGYEEGKKKGVTFIALPDEEQNQWSEAVKPVVEAYLDQLEKAGYNRAQLNEMVAYIKERIQYWTKKQAEAGIKSLTGPEEIRVKLD